jgi:hypothetical protein
LGSEDWSPKFCAAGILSTRGNHNRINGLQSFGVVWPVSGIVVGRSIDALSDAERIAFYRQLALEALQRAQRAATDHQATAYLDIATRWTSIADEVERWAARQAELEACGREANESNCNVKRH